VKIVGPSDTTTVVATVIRMDDGCNGMAKNLIVSALACLLLSAWATAEPTELRVWRTSDGKQVVRAEAIDAKYDRKTKATLIHLKRPNGTTLAVPFHKLDKQGRELAWYGVHLRRAKARSRPFTLLPPGTVEFKAAPLSPVDAEEVPETVLRKGNTVLLGIDPRMHALGRPPEGWCGEVAIQEALLYYGVYYPQAEINAAGNPVHPDLYSNEIPRALRNLGMEIRQWPWRPTDLGDFLGWVRKQVSAGLPVLTGVKIYPTKHDEWSLDHFVLAVGVEGDSLALNTTTSTTASVSWVHVSMTGLGRSGFSCERRRPIKWQ
jgi:hypothetical protein